MFRRYLYTGLGDGFRGEGMGEWHASHDFSVVIYGKEKLEEEISSIGQIY